MFVDFSIPVLFLFFGLILLTFLFGRIYCSTVCPFGIIQECFDILYKKLAKKKKKNPPQKNYKYKYIVAFVSFGVLLGGSTVLIRYTDPYTIALSAFSLSIFGIILTTGVLILVFFKNRFFCTNICPVGAILGLIAKYSLFKIKMNKNDCVACGVCARSCPCGCIDIKEGTVDNEICVKCLKCIRVCPQNAMNFEFEKRKIKKPEFNPTRREVLIGLGTTGAFLSLVAVGVSFSKNLAKKIKNVILPPGAENANRMANKCLNCNLCVNNCPTKILVKANKDFSSVHIDYSKGDGYCEYNCNNCGKVCPTGAIKRLQIQDKQVVRIAIATIGEKCNRCGVCEIECPTGAIEKLEDGSYKVDGTKCIGCSRCQASCKHDAITISAINNQTII